MSTGECSTWTINYTDTKAFVGFSYKLTCRKFSAINLPSEQTNSSSKGGGQGLADVRERLVHSLPSFLLQNSKNCYLFSLKLNIYQILYIHVYMV
jgi:hypothetical protein